MDNNTSKTFDTNISKDKFNSMSIPEQIQLVNRFIKLGDSISKLAKMLGYNETTLRDRYKRAGYTRVTNRGIFVPNEELEQARAKLDKGIKNKSTKSKVVKNKVAKNKGNTEFIYQKTSQNITVKDNDMIIENTKYTKDSGVVKMKAENTNVNIQGQENLLNTIELGDNIFNLLPAEQGAFSTALELNKAVKRNINIRTSKEVSRKLLSIYNFLSSMEPVAGDAINYTSIISGALSLYFDKLQAEYGDLFNKYIVEVEPETSNTNYHKAVEELLKLVNEK